MKYGFTDTAWDAAKVEMITILAARAKLRGMISYSDLAAKISAVTMSPDSHALAAMLGEVSQEEDDDGRGMLSVIVVHKVGDMQPGVGFFKLAKARGRRTADEVKCWVDELKNVYAFWSLP